MGQRSQMWLAAVLLGAGGLVGPSALRAEYILCYDAPSVRSRVSCEATCREGERLVQRSDDDWAGCGQVGPDCGTAWSEWESEMAVGDATPLLDPCPAGCWRTETVDAEFRTVTEGAEIRELWRCQGVEAAG